MSRRPALTLHFHNLETLRNLERAAADLDRDIRPFARSEVEVEDPLQARRVESSDA